VVIAIFFLMFFLLGLVAFCFALLIIRYFQFPTPVIPIFGLMFIFGSGFDNGIALQIGITMFVFAPYAGGALFDGIIMHLRVS